MAPVLETRPTRIALWVFVVVLVYLRRLGVEGCSISPPTVVCSGGGRGCDIFNNQGLWEDRTPCRAAASVFPTTEAELVAAVAQAVKKKKKVNVVSGLAHSHTRLVCVGEGGFIISTRDYASTPLVNPTAKTITVEAGVIIRDLLNVAAKAGLAFPTSTSWDGVSAAGSVSTGAHGSGLVGKGSAINEYVVAMRLVIPAPASEGYAKVIELTEKDEDLKAARFALGTLGAISKITFALQPMFKRSVSLSLEDDAGLEDRLESFLRGYEFSNVYWYVGHGKAFMGKIHRAPVNRPGNGVNNAYQPTTVFNVETSASTYEAIQATEDSKKLCNRTGTSMNNRVSNGGGFLTDGIRFTGYPVVGFNHLMVASGSCEDYHQKHDNQSSCTASQIIDKNQSICAWDRRARGRLTFDLEIRVPLSRAREAILDLKKIRALNPESLCALEGSGIIMRTIKKSEGAYLGPAEDVVTFEIVYHRSRLAYVPTWDMDVYQEIEQMLIEKHGGSLHWGKSGGHLFQGLAQKSTVNLQQFLTVKKRFDPDGLFSNEWTNGLLGIGGHKVEVLKNGCALEKLCKCREDIHCAPQAGYLCRPGRVWKNARVCRKGN